jgi:hypothetical protein
MVERLALLLCIREGPGSNLASQTDYSDRGFRDSSSVFLEKCRDGTKLGHDRFLLIHFQFISHLSPYHSTLYSNTHWKNYKIYWTRSFITVIAAPFPLDAKLSHFNPFIMARNITSYEFNVVINGKAHAIGMLSCIASMSWTRCVFLANSGTHRTGRQAFLSSALNKKENYFVSDVSGTS